MFFKSNFFSAALLAAAMLVSSPAFTSVSFAEDFSHPNPDQLRTAKVVFCDDAETMKALIVGTLATKTPTFLLMSQAPFVNHCWADTMATFHIVDSVDKVVNINGLDLYIYAVNIDSLTDNDINEAHKHPNFMVGFAQHDSEADAPKT